jgi:hypothetical protein
MTNAWDLNPLSFPGLAKREAERQKQLAFLVPGFFGRAYGLRRLGAPLAEAGRQWARSLIRRGRLAEPGGGRRGRGRRRSRGLPAQRRSARRWGGLISDSPRGWRGRWRSLRCWLSRRSGAGNKGGSDPYFVKVSTPSRSGHWQSRTRLRRSSKLARP